jgi:hypothetical protein
VNDDHWPLVLVVYAVLLVTALWFGLAAEGTPDDPPEPAGHGTCGPGTADG